MVLSGTSALSWAQLVALTLGQTPSPTTWAQVTAATWNLIGYTPTQEQREVHEAKNAQGEVCRRVLVEGGIQSGKSTLTAAEIMRRLPWLSGQEVWFCGPDFKQSRKECEYLIEWTQKIGLFNPRKASLPGSDAPWDFTLKNGTRIRTFSAVNYRKMAGSTPGFVALVEPGQMPDAEPFYIALARAGLRGVPLWLVGTLEGSTNWYAQLAKRWSRGSTKGAVAFKLPTWTNTHLFPLGRRDPKILEAENDPSAPRERFLERYAGEQVAPPGLVFGPTDFHPGFDPLLHVQPIRFGLGDEDGRTISLPADTPREVWVDWGWDHPYAVLCVVVTGDPQTVHVVREVVQRGITDPAMIRLVQGQDWYRNVQRAILDPSMKQHRSGPLTSRDYWAANPPIGAGLPTWADERVLIDDGTAKIRRLLEVNPQTGRPRLLIDPSCQHLIWEFQEGYRNLIDLNGQSLGKPIDRNNDAIKALHYGTHVHFPGLVETPARRKRSALRALPFD